MSMWLPVYTHCWSFLMAQTGTDVMFVSHIEAPGDFMFNTVLSLLKKSYSRVNCLFLWNIVPINFLWSNNGFTIFLSKFLYQFGISSCFISQQNSCCSERDFIQTDFLHFQLTHTRSCADKLQQGIVSLFGYKRFWNQCMIFHNIIFCEVLFKIY